MSASDIESMLFSAESVDKTPVIGTVSTYLKDLLKPKSSKEATHVFHRNLIGIKVLFLVIVLFAAIINHYKYRKQSGKDAILKKPLFWVECLIVGLSMSLSTLLLIMSRDKNLIRHSGIKWNSIIIKCISLGIIFFILNVVFEFSGLYSTYYESQNESAIEPPSEEPVSPIGRAKVSFTYAIYTIVVIVIAVVLINMLWSMIVARDTNTNYNFGLESYKWLYMVAEAILFAVIGAAPLFLTAKNRSGKVSNKTAKEFGLFVLKYLIVYAGLQLSGTFNEWFSKN
jgi:hypothetical protein